MYSALSKSFSTVLCLAVLLVSPQTGLSSLCAEACATAAHADCRCPHHAADGDRAAHARHGASDASDPDSTEAEHAAHGHGGHSSPAGQAAAGDTAHACAAHRAGDSCVKEGAPTAPEPGSPLVETRPEPPAVLAHLVVPQPGHGSWNRRTADDLLPQYVADPVSPPPRSFSTLP